VSRKNHYSEILRHSGRDILSPSGHSNPASVPASREASRESNGGRSEASPARAVARHARDSLEVDVEAAPADAARATGLGTLQDLSRTDDDMLEA